LENLKIQTNLIENSFKNKVKRLLFLGSSCIYPKFAKQPIKEEYLLDGKLESTNEWYALAKIAGIKLCEALREQENFDSICLMPTNLYGPGDNYHPLNSHVLPALIRKFFEAKKNNLPSVTCWGSGKPYREFLHVDDLAKACVFALEKWDPNAKSSPKDINGNPLNFLNVGTGIDLSIKELASIIADKVGYKGFIKWDTSKPDGTPKKLLDISRIKSLGWQPSISLDNGISKTIKLYENLQKDIDH
jgi:GDP-L-fucose synthase